ncbi:hypothetical protein [Streptomyces diastatochromogenes]|uniref:hypothetical protein n=1 Tax=Streptomyces diastatochromogenes TaxID=42236 RepID=UPI003688E7CC
MTLTAAELLAATTARLAPDPPPLSASLERGDPHPNSLVPLIARGEASRETLAALALEQRWVITADHRSFLHLALAAFAQGSGVTEERTRSHPPAPAGRPTPPTWPGWPSTAHRPT